MSRILLDHGADGILTDTGDVIIRPKELSILLRKGKDIGGLCTFWHHDETGKPISMATRLVTEEYNARNNHQPYKKLQVADIDGIPGEFPPRLYEWKIPREYRELDLIWYLVKRLEQQFPEMSDVYIDRVQLEYEMMLERGMEDFLRLVVYIMHTLNEHGIVHGIGRGSACASLVLYLIGVHMVDPILYDIPITEFLR